MEYKVKVANKQGYVTCESGGAVNLCYPDSTTRRGRAIENGRICPTITTENVPSILEDWIWEVDGVEYLIRIRKLTPKECFRLMGFAHMNEDGTWDDSVFERAESVNSNSQLYKQAGNSICVPCLEAIFRELIGVDNLKQPFDWDFQIPEGDDNEQS